jgi:hypothetical protein
MTTTARLEPKSLNETTLETNIVSEIASLLNYSTDYNSYPRRIRWFFDVHPNNLPIIQNKRKVKIYRLTPREENIRGGWDSKIVIPNGDGTKRALFIQFKAGKHSDGNEVSNSIFNINIQKPNKHAEFTFNDNSNNNQHQTLKKLHDELTSKGFPSKSVMYAFPRITDLQLFDDLEEDLILHTTFLSISEMDAKANGKGICLYDNQKHHFRTCYNDETKREISSEPFSIGKSEDFGLLYEILLIKFADFHNKFHSIVPTRYIIQEFYFILSDFLRINPFTQNNFRYSGRSEDYLYHYYTKIEENSVRNNEKTFGSINIEWKKNLFKSISNFISDLPNKTINLQDEIPSEYSFSLNKEMILDLKMEENDSFNLITF